MEELKILNLIAALVFAGITIITEKPSHAMFAVINFIAAQP